ncbi:MAG: MFS transporter, partial [Chloroflexota bacterium]|nr:MFS transporter [Chloroflexota bacterium]
RGSAPKTDASDADGGLALARALWPVLLATFAYSLPISAISIFVALIAADLDTSVAVVGGLRGISGVAALVVGFGLAPLIDRVPRAPAVAAMLLLGAVADVFAVVGQVGSLVVFYALLGVMMAALLPTLQAASADRFHGPTSGQAAGLVTSCQALSVVVAGPLLALPATIAGWRGAFVAMAVVAVAMAVIAALTLAWQRPPNVARPGYREAFALVARAPGALPLLFASTLRSCAWFAWLTYLAAFFADRFDASTIVVSWVWFVGAGAFFVANLLASRHLNSTAGHPAPWGAPTRLLAVGAVANVGFAPLVFIAPTVPLALLATALFCVSSGIMLAALISLLIRRYAALRGAVMGLNAAGLNVGTIVGAAAAGLGLGLGGYAGLAAMLVLMAGAAAAAILVAVRSLHEPAAPSEVPAPA